MKYTSRWDSKVGDEQANLKILTNLALSHCRDCGEEGALVASWITTRDWNSLCEYDPPYERLPSPDVVFHLRQALGFFQKLECLRLVGVDKEKVAREAFYRSELDCLKTNMVFSKWDDGELQFSPFVEAVLFSAQRKISRVLGVVPSIDSLDIRFGPGATPSIKRRDACARTKLSSRLQCSTNMEPVLGIFLESAYQLAALHAVSESETGWLVPCEIIPGKLAFVPKNAKTYRSVVVEPGCNMMLQQGIGRYMAKRLLSVGIDTTDQTRNQEFARIGSLTGALATLDLSSASDLISYGLVAHLLPPDWLGLLGLARTGEVLIDGKILYLHKFSSMGNGYTFPLETLIFWSLVKATCDQLDIQGDVTVFGDDIIAPCAAIPAILDVLRVCGFRVNYSKSFWTGVFRESCGKDYFGGTNVRPLYVKDHLTYESLFRIHNFYFRRYDFARAAIVLALIPEHLRIYGPDGYGDGHLLAEKLSGVLLPYRRNRGWCGFLFETFTHKGRFHSYRLPGDVILPAYSIYHSGSGNGLGFTPFSKENGGPVVSLPGTRGYKRISIYTLRA